MDVLSALVSLSVLVASAVEALKTYFLKPAQGYFSWSDDLYGKIVYSVAFLVGIVLATFAGQSVNLFGLFPLFSGVPPFVGLLLSGVLAALGSDAIHSVYDFIRILGGSKTSSP